MAIVSAIVADEAKPEYVWLSGSTSSRAGSPRHSKPFTNSQVFDRVAKGVYTAIAGLNTGADSCLAFPDEPMFLRYVEPDEESLARARRTLGSG